MAHLGLLPIPLSQAGELCGGPGVVVWVAGELCGGSGSGGWGCDLLYSLRKNFDLVTYAARLHGSDRRKREAHGGFEHEAGTGPVRVNLGA